MKKRNLLLSFLVFCAVSLQVQAINEVGWSIIKDTGNGLPPTGSGRLIWGDFNNDGRLDAFIISGGQVHLYRNDGSNNFTEVQVGTFQGLNEASAVFIDYNNDGWLDLITVGKDGGAQLRIYKNNNGTFARDTSTEDTTGAHGNKDNGRAIICSGNGDAAGRMLNAVDYNHDGWMDLVISGNCTYNLYAWNAYNGGGGWGWSNRYTALYKNQNGSFSHDDNPINGGGNFLQVSGGSIAVGDVNKDGYADILSVGYHDYSPTGGGWSARLYVNDGNGKFTVSPYSSQLNGDERCDYVIVDVNGDGYGDIAEIGGNKSNIHINNKAGSFTKYDDTSTGLLKSNGGGGVSVAAGDINNDGYMDLLITGMGISNHTKIFYNNGDNTFTAGDVLAGMRARSGSAALVDINGDNNLDFSNFGWGEDWTTAFAVNTLGTEIETNTPPAKPTNVSVSIPSTGKYLITWKAATDAESPQSAIQYNLYARNTSTGATYFYAPANINTGKLKIGGDIVPLISTTSFTWTLPAATYVFGVSAVDQAFAASEFAKAAITWTGTTSTAWATASNWSSSVAPGANDSVFIPAGKARYPVLTANVSMKALIMEPGASIDLSSYTLSASGGIIAQTVMDNKKWYSVGFPFNIANIYSYDFDANIFSKVNCWIKDFDGTKFNMKEAVDPINKTTGYIIQLPSGFPNGSQLYYTSGAAALTKGALTYTNDTYVLQANPTLAPLTINGPTLAVSNQYVYKLDPVTSDYLLIEGTATIAPFEAIATFKKVTLSPAPKIVVDTEVITGLEKPVLNEKAIETVYYNLQGQKITAPQQGSVYIVKTIYESGKTEMAKQIK